MERKKHKNLSTARDGTRYHCPSCEWKGKDYEIDDEYWIRESYGNENAKIPKYPGLTESISKFLSEGKDWWVIHCPKCNEVLEGEVKSWHTGLLPKSHRDELQAYWKRRDEAFPNPNLRCPECFTFRTRVGEGDLYCSKCDFTWKALVGGTLQIPKMPLDPATWSGTLQLSWLNEREKI